MTDHTMSYGSIARLSNFLTTVQEKQPNQTIRWHLAKIIGFPETDMVATIVAYGDLAQLARSAKEEIIRYGSPNPKLHIKPLEHVEATIGNMGINNTAQELINNIGPHNVLSVEHCAYLVQSLPSEKLIPVDVLSELLSKVNGFINAVLDPDDLPAYLKNLLLEHLYSIQRAINNYRIDGVKGLKRAVEQSIGAMHLANEQIRKEAGEDKTNIPWQYIANFLSVIDAINNVISLYDYGPRLALMAAMAGKLLGVDIPGS